MTFLLYAVYTQAHMINKESLRRGAKETGLSQKQVQDVIYWLFYQEIPHVCLDLGKKIFFSKVGFFESVYTKRVRGMDFETMEQKYGGARYRIAFRAKELYRRDVKEDEHVL